MLLLSVFLVSCCLPGSMGAAITEFQVNLKALLALMNKETFIQVPSGKFQCSHVPCQLNKTIEGLKKSLKDDQMRTHVAPLEKNMDHIISALSTGHTTPKDSSACDTTEVPPQKVLRRFSRYFRKLHENCSRSW